MKTSTVKWVWSIGLVGLSAVAFAGEPQPASAPSAPATAHVAHPQEPVGFVTGAVVGAFAAGPIGALVGAGLGTWLGNRVHKASEATKAEARLAALESAEAARANLAPPSAAAAAPPAVETQSSPESTSAFTKPTTAADTSAPLDGFQGDVMFRTGSAEITPEIAHQVHMLAQAVMKSASAERMLKVRVDGYADPRGSDEVNLKLSQDRAEAVLGLLLDAGVPSQVVEIHAYGKTQSVAKDLDGYALERRVRLTLQADGDSEVFTVGQNE